MNIYKITVMNKEYIDVLPSLYFEQASSAENTIVTMNLLYDTVGKKLQWKREIIHAFSEVECAEQMAKGIGDVIKFIAKDKSKKTEPQKQTPKKPSAKKKVVTKKKVATKKSSKK